MTTLTSDKESKILHGSAWAAELVLHPMWCPTDCRSHWKISFWWIGNLCERKAGSLATEATAKLTSPVSETHTGTHAHTVYWQHKVTTP